jgi:p38 MAP kinase
MSQYLLDNQEERKKAKRQMSSEIMTRWYRSPEICLTEKHYDKSVDIWSMGIILSEMLFCSTPYANDPKFDSSKRFLFNGNSSFPLSPKGDGIEESDQLMKILNYYPELDTERDLSFLSDEESKKFVKSLHDGLKDSAKSLKCSFPKTKPELLELLESMLQFNPHHRQTANELLQHKIFDKVRDRNNESIAPHKISLSFDKKTYNIDYEKNRLRQEAGSEKQIMKYFVTKVVQEAFKSDY